MTKFILHGGETGVVNDHNKAFYQEWVKDFDTDYLPNILLVYFARADELWDQLKKSDIERFAEYTNDRKTKFVLADSDMDVFKKQVSEADVVYFRGGDPLNIVDTLKPIQDELISLLDNKVYAGSSAGVMFLSKYSRSIHREWQEWLGLLPINSFVHFSEDQRDLFETFQAESPDEKNEYLLIPETEFVVKYF